MLEFELTRKELLPSLLLLAGTVEKKQSMPILANVLIRVKQQSLELFATDTEISLQAKIALNKPCQDGDVTVPAKKLIDICRSLKDDDRLVFKEQTGKVMLTAAKSRFSLASLPAKDFPVVTDEIKETELTLPKEALEQLFQRTYFAMAQLDVRYYLNGLLLDIDGPTITAVATDGHRLATCHQQLSADLPSQRLILPRKGVLELSRLLSEIADEQIGLSISKNHCYLISNDYEFSSKLIEGRFPNYKRVIPQHQDKSLIVDKDALKQSISRVSILANEKYRGVEFKVSPCLLTIIATNQEQEEAIDELEVDTEGEAMSFGVNASYLLDVLNHADSGLVKLSFSKPGQGILIVSVDEPNSQYVIMPLKL